MQINIYIPKGSEDVLNLHFIEENEMEAVAEEPEQADEPEGREPKIIRDPTPCGPHPEGSPEALAAIERVKKREAEREHDAAGFQTGKKRGRKKKEES